MLSTKYDIHHEVERRRSIAAQHILGIPPTRHTDSGRNEGRSNVGGGDGRSLGPIHFAFRAKHGYVPLPFFHRKWREAHGRGEVVPSAATATSFFYAGVTSSK